VSGSGASRADEDEDGDDEDDGKRPGFNGSTALGSPPPGAPPLISKPGDGEEDEVEGSHLYGMSRKYWFLEGGTPADVRFLRRRANISAFLAEYIDHSTVFSLRSTFMILPMELTTLLASRTAGLMLFASPGIPAPS